MCENPPITVAALGKLALKNQDFYGAVAVYSLADKPQQQALQSLMFAQRRDRLMLARWEHTPASVLEALCECDDCFVALRLSKNKNTPTHVLENSIKSEHQTVLLALVAQHPNASAAILQQIVESDTDVNHLKVICSNSAANVNILNALLQLGRSDLDKLIVGNPNASQEILQALYIKGDIYLRAAVLGHENCPFDLVMNAVNDAVNSNEILVQRQLAKNTMLSSKELAKLAHHTDPAIRANVMANTSFKAEDLFEFTQDESTAVRRALATRLDLSLRDKQALAVDADDWVRQWLGRNPTLDLNLMQQLASDKVLEVRRSVARNPCCPVSLLEHLATDKSAWVRAAVAYQHNATSNLMTNLANDGDVDVLSGVASNPHTSTIILSELAKDKDANIRRGVIHNPSATREILLPMLADAYYLHRILLVGKKNLSLEDKWSLHKDPDERVRFSVFKWFANALHTKK